jgi:hypothetical protein
LGLGLSFHRILSRAGTGLLHAILRLVNVRKAKINFKLRMRGY